MDILTFWEITPFELNIAAKSHEKRKIAESKDSMYQAYLISRWVWQKKIDIKKMLDTEKKKPMTDEQMLEKVKALNRLFGGEVKQVGQK